MTMIDRRSVLQGGTALAAASMLSGEALLDYARAWAQASPWKPEKGAKLTIMRWKRFVPAEDEAFMAMVEAFKKANGVEVNVFSESFEDLQPKASVSANTGQGPDVVWGLHSLAAIVPGQSPRNERCRRLSRQEIRRLDQRCGNHRQVRATSGSAFRSPRSAAISTTASLRSRRRASRKFRRIFPASSNS